MIKEDIKDTKNIIENEDIEIKNDDYNSNNNIILNSPWIDQENFPDLEKTVINSVKLEVTQLKENLSKCQKKADDLLQENNKLKIEQIENSKKISMGENIINSNKIEINQLQTKNSNLESENEEKKNIIQELNYKIIELSQKIESYESINKIDQKIKNEEIKIGDKDYLLEINGLYNKINEIEIKNSKLKFDNKNLLAKIELQKNDIKNEMEIMELLHKKKIENLEKNIMNLNDTINELIIEKRKQPKEFNSFGIQKEIYNNFAELKQKIRIYDNDNFILNKEIQKIKNENEELKIIINGKDNIIDKLQTNINKMEKEFMIKLSEIRANYNSLNNNNDMIGNNKNQYSIKEIEKIMNEREKLMEENIYLKENYEQMTVGINEANELFLNKQKEYENLINSQNEKLKEYKFKISLLKIKINELYSEINFLKERQINNHYNFIQPMNDNITSKNDIQQQFLDLNYTPELNKKINSYRGRNFTQRSNDETNNLNDKENNI